MPYAIGRPAALAPGSIESAPLQTLLFLENSLFNDFISHRSLRCDGSGSLAATHTLCDESLPKNGHWIRQFTSLLLQAAPSRTAGWSTHSNDRFYHTLGHGEKTSLKNARVAGLPSLASRPLTDSSQIWLHS